MNQHTPGPWKISNPASLVCQEVRNNKDYLVARVGGPFIQDKELTANAHLIAKAPEMIQWIERMLGILREGPVACSAAPYGGAILQMEAEALLREMKEEKDQL